MSERERIAGLAEQMELAQKYLDQWPDWLRSIAHFSGTNHSSDVAAGVDEQTSENKTVVPVRLAQHGDDLLISRSQAKHLLARVDRFRTVLFDFEGVAAVGQAFADEIFRVFRAQHPNMDLFAINASTDVQNMINRALSANVGLSAPATHKPVQDDDRTG